MLDSLLTLELYTLLNQILYKNKEYMKFEI